MKKLSFIILLSFISVSVFAGDFIFQNRLQLDTAVKHAEGRVRVDMNHTFENGTYSIPFEIKAYALFKPVKYVFVGAGNSFFKKYPVQAAYLAASDDYLKTGRLLRNGLGVLGNIPFSDDVKLSLSTSIGPDEWNDDAETDVEYAAQKIDVNAGFNLSVLDRFSIGAVANKINGTEFQAGVYGGFEGNEDFANGLLINTGYIYNFRDSFMAKTQHGLMMSAGYKINALGLGFYGDFITGLNSNYLKKSGKIKNYENNQIPFYGALAVVYDGLDDWNVYLRSKVCAFSGNGTLFTDPVWGFVTGTEYVISKKAGSVSLETEISWHGSEVSGEIDLGWKMRVLGK